MRKPTLPPAMASESGAPAARNTVLAGNASATLRTVASRALTMNDVAGVASSLPDSVPRSSPHSSGHASTCQETGIPALPGSTRTSPAPFQSVPLALASRNLPADSTSRRPSTSDAGAVITSAAKRSAAPMTNTIARRIALRRKRELDADLSGFDARRRGEIDSAQPGVALKRFEQWRQRVETDGVEHDSQAVVIDPLDAGRLDALARERRVEICARIARRGCGSVARQRDDVLGPAPRIDERRALCCELSRQPFGVALHRLPQRKPRNAREHDNGGQR